MAARTVTPVTITITYEMEFSGAGSGWTDITADVRIEPSPRWNWGITGSQPTDLVAAPGTFVFALDNSTGNSAGLVGYYSIDHTNARSGFDLNIGVRVKMVYGGVTKYKKYYLRSIQVVPGNLGRHMTMCHASDYMDIAAQYKPRSLALQRNQRGDEIFATIHGDISPAPANTSSTNAVSSYPYALDGVEADKETALAIFQKLANSGLDRVYVQGDATDGETLVFEPHQARLKEVTNTVNFDDDHKTFQTALSRARIINVVDVGTPIKSEEGRIDSEIVLSSLDSNRPIIGVGETVTVTMDYRDPDNPSTKAGGYSMLDPVATTDYTANSESTGAGTDLTSDIAIVATFTATRATLAITNNHATLTAYMTALQVRGIGVFTQGKIHTLNEDATSKTTYGERLVPLTMNWQTNVNIADAAGAYMLDQRKDPIGHIPQFTYVANNHDELADAALAVDISDRIGITETVTGISSAGGEGWWVQSITMVYKQQAELQVTYGLEFSEIFPGYWQLGATASDDLGVDTKLGFL